MPNFSLRDVVTEQGSEGCPKHGDRIRFFCPSHQCVGCASCFLEDHIHCPERVLLQSAGGRLQAHLAELERTARSKGSRLEKIQESLAERMIMIADRRAAQLQEIENYFDTYIFQVLKRRDQIKEEANAYHDRLETSVRAQRSHVARGLDYLGARYRDIEAVTKQDLMTRLRVAPQLATTLANAIDEAEAALPQLESLPLPEFPFFRAPPEAANLMALLSLSVHLAEEPALPESSSVGEASELLPGAATVSPPGVSKGAASGAPASRHVGGQLPIDHAPPPPDESVTSKTRSTAVSPRQYPAISPSSPAPSTPPVRSHTQDVHRPDISHTSGAPMPITSHEGTTEGEWVAVAKSKKKVSAGQKPVTSQKVAHSLESMENSEVEACVDNTANEGNDGFLHFRDKDGERKHLPRRRVLLLIGDVARLSIQRIFQLRG
jgi:hypothetical protein